MFKVNKRKGKIIFETIGELSYSKILDIVPSNIFLTKKHIDICSEIAILNGFSEDLQKIYTNILVKHSQEAKIITSIVFLSNKYKILHLDASFLTRELLSNFIDIENIKFENIEFIKKDFINKGQFRKLIIKFFLNKLYRLFFVKRESKKLVRSWVEISESMYQEEYENDSLILIYPFYLNLKRHLKYINNCKKNNYNFSLSGIPYSFKDLIQIILSSDKKDYYYSIFEFNGFYNHAREFSTMNIKSVYTSDEFEAASFILYQELFNEKIKSFNTAHGMSFGCPYLYYNKFQVYNNSQKSYYQYKSDLDFVIKERQNIKIEKSLMNLNIKFKPVLVYLEGNFTNLNMNYEINFETKITELLLGIHNNDQYDINVVVKLHPNNVNSNNRILPTIVNLNEIQASKIVFISYLSAAYYDFKHLGDFIFLEDEFTNAKLFYGDKNLTTVKINEFEKELRDRIL